MRRNSIGGDVRKTQTVWTCDRCHKQHVGPPGTRRDPDGWVNVQVPMENTTPDSTPAILVVDANLCGECAGHLARWMKPVEV